MFFLLTSHILLRVLYIDSYIYVILSTAIHFVINICYSHNFQNFYIHCTVYQKIYFSFLLVTYSIVLRLFWSILLNSPPLGAKLV